MKRNAKTFLSEASAKSFAALHTGAEIWSGMDAFGQREFTVRWEDEEEEENDGNEE